MTNPRLVTSILLLATVAACSRHEPVVAPPVPSSKSVEAPAATAAQRPVEDTAEQQERAAQQAKLDFATMEDGFLNDAKGQWAQSAKATSTFGDDEGKTPSDVNAAANATGVPDDKSWTNNRQNMGFDSLELSYPKSVNATGVRIVCDDNAVQSISKIELLESGGLWHTVWSGLSDIKPEKRGPRNWFVKSFDATTYQTNAAKITFANNLASGYKVVNAVQLIGH